MVYDAIPAAWDAVWRATNCSDSRGYAREALGRGISGGGAYAFFAAPIQQESTFWRRFAWERIGRALSPIEFRAGGGDFEFWCRFAKHAQLYAVNVLLGGFRQHGDQQIANARDEYFRQACRALENLPSGARQPSWYRRCAFMRDRLRHAGSVGGGAIGRPALRKRRSFLEPATTPCSAHRPREGLEHEATPFLYPEAETCPLAS